MPLPFFYEENLPGDNELTLSEESSRHIVQVLRKQEGEQVLLTNGKGQTLTVEIIAAHKRKTQVKIVHKEFLPQRKPKVAIAISYIKSASRFEWFLEKATELGVSAIIPLICKRTEKTHFRKERMTTILVSAMLQSRQAWLPEIAAPITISELLKKEDWVQKFIAHCIEEQKSILNHSIIDAASSKIILIGPEGDFTPEEVEEALEQGYLPVSLGNTRLRTETAGLVASVLLMNVG